MASIEPTHEFSASLEDGILYADFLGELSLNSIMEVESRLLKLLQEQRIEHAPAIVSLDKLADGAVKLSLVDFGKLLSTIGLIRHLSDIFVVGAGPQARKPIDMLNKMFFSNRIGFYATLQEAQAAARASLPASLSILERD